MIEAAIDFGVLIGIWTAIAVSALYMDRFLDWLERLDDESDV